MELQGENVLTRFLAHQDVLGMIFFHLTPELPGVDEVLRAKRRLLWACSLACKGFFHPALDALWSYMSSISPLCRLLPYEEKNGQYVLRGAIEPVQWRIFESYARRIRIFGGFGASDAKWKPVIDDICSIIGPSAPLPAVRSLYSPFFMERSRQPRPLAVLSLIDLGQLHSVVLANVNALLYDGFVKDLMEELSLAHGASGHLRFLNLEGYFAHQSLSLFGAFRKLERFKLILRAVTLEHDFLHTLGRLPSLESLDLDFKACNWQAAEVIAEGNVVQRPAFPRRFPALQFLRIAGSLTVILAMLKELALAQSALPSIEAVCRIIRPDHDIPSCVHGILPLKNLRSLTIANTERWRGCNLDERWLAPLVELPDLNSLTINGFQFKEHIVISHLKLPLTQ